MTPQEEFLQLIHDTVEKNCELSTALSLKELPAEGGLYAELGSGFMSGQYYDKSAVRTMPVLFLCRNKDQKAGLAELSKICNYLQTLKEYPQGKKVAWMNAVTAKEPNKIGRDENGMYHHSCIVNCQIYF